MKVGADTTETEKKIKEDIRAIKSSYGEELIVRDGRWFTVKGGAQFTELKKGDIVFNHLHTRQLLRNEKITSSDIKSIIRKLSGI